MVILQQLILIQNVFNKFKKVMIIVKYLTINLQIVNLLYLFIEAGKVIVGTPRNAMPQKTMGAEDFSYFMLERPGCFIFVGCALPGELRPHVLLLLPLLLLLLTLLLLLPLTLLLLLPPPLLLLLLPPLILLLPLLLLLLITYYYSINQYSILMKTLFWFHQVYLFKSLETFFVNKYQRCFIFLEGVSKLLICLN